MPAVKYFPDWYDPNQKWLPQGMIAAPPMTLIDGKVFGTAKRIAQHGNPDAIVGRGGVTAVRNTDASPQFQLNWIYNHIFNSTNKGSADNLTNADVVAIAGTVQLVQLFVDEMAEGVYGMPASNPKYRLFWETIRDRCIQEGIAYRHAGTYGSQATVQGDPWEFMTGDGSQKPPNHPIFKALLANQAAARKKPNGDTQDFYALGLDTLMGCNVKHYADSPDYASRYYNKAWACQVMNLAYGQPRGMPSAKLLYISWPNIEGLGSDSQDLHNGYYYSRRIEGKGEVRQIEHPEIDFDYMIGEILMNGFIRMGGYVIFDSAYMFSNDPATIDPRNPYVWNPDVAGTAAPLATPGFPHQPLGFHDAPFIAAHQYNQFGRTAGTPWKACAYKIVGTENFIEPTPDYTDILEHASANDGAYTQTGRRGRMDALFREKNGSVDLALFDASRNKYTTETVILRPMGPGTKEFAASVKGSKILGMNETL